MILLVVVLLLLSGCVSVSPHEYSEETAMALLDGARHIAFFLLVAAVVNGALSSRKDK